MAHGQNKFQQHDGQSYAPVIRDFGAGPIRCFEIACGKCGDKGWAGNTRDMRLPCEAVYQIFRKLGWVVHPRRASSHRCPECQLHPQTSDERVSVMATVSALLPRQLTGYETRKVGELLNANFNEQEGRFSPQWSDDRIAKEINVPRAAVVKFREEGWGKIKVFSDLEALKSEVASVKSMIEDLEKRVLIAEKARY